MPTPLPMNTEVIGWITTANYSTIVADDGDVQLRSLAGTPTRYFIRRRGPERLELTQADLDDAGDSEQALLFVADVGVLECYLIGLFADDIRDELGLPFLDLRYDADHVAAGYALSDMVRGYRTLTCVGRGPVAAAPDPELSLMTLVPLSHLLGWSIPELKRSFLDAAGAPLLRNGQYRPPGSAP